jgi:hypothetical protein
LQHIVEDLSDFQAYKYYTGGMQRPVRRRDIDVVLVRRLDRWGRSVTDLPEVQALEHLGPT